MPDGSLTARIVNSLKQKFEKQGFKIFHDHRLNEIASQGEIGKLRIWFGDTLKRESLLADIDIAIISSLNEEVIFLIEIEETTAKPKVILGDVLAILLGNGINFRNEKNFKIGSWTSLIVMSYDRLQSHQRRYQYLIEKTNSLKSNLDTDNASIGLILLDSFMNENQLETKLLNHIESAITRYRGDKANTKSNISN